MTGTSLVIGLPSWAQAERSPALKDLHLLDSGYSLDNPRAFSPAQLIASIFEPGITTRKINATRAEYLSRRQQASQMEKLEGRHRTEAAEQAGGLMYFSLDPSRKPGSYFFAETPKNRSTRRIIHLPEDFPVAKKRRMQQEEELEDEMDMDIATGSSRGRSQSVSSAGEELIVSRVATPHDATLRPPSSGINSVASTSTSNSGTTLDSPPPTSLAPAPPSPPISSRRPSSPLPPVRALPVVPIASASSQRPSPVIPPRPPTLPNRPSSNNDEQRTFSPLVIPAPPPPSLFARPKIFQAPHSQSTARAAYSPPLPSTPLGAAPSWTERSSLPPHPSLPFGPQPNPYGLPNPYGSVPNPYHPSPSPFPTTSTSTSMSPPPASSHLSAHIPDPPDSVKPLLKLLLLHEERGEYAPQGSTLGAQLAAAGHKGQFGTMSELIRELGYATMGCGQKQGQDFWRLETGTARLNARREVVAGFQLPQPSPVPISTPSSSRPRLPVASQPPVRPSAAIDDDDLSLPFFPSTDSSYATTPTPGKFILPLLILLSSHLSRGNSLPVRSIIGSEVSLMRGNFKGRYQMMVEKANEDGWIVLKKDFLTGNKDGTGGKQKIGLSEMGKKWARERVEGR